MRRLVLAFLLAACSDDDSGSGSIPIDALEGELIDIYCDLYVECGLVDDYATCIMLDLDIEFDADLRAAVEAGKVLYNSSKARECLNSISATTCNRYGGLIEGTSEACDQTFTGTVGAGGACGMDAVCLSQECSIPSCPDACCQGTCVGDAPPVRPQLGQACTFDGPSCATGYCDDTTLVCTARKPAGATCGGSTECESRYCSGTVCASLADTGQPCSSTMPCGKLGDTCSQTTMTCVPYGLSGDSCMSARDCSPVYACDSSMTCVLGPTVGDSCPTGGCIDNSYCDVTTMLCTAPKADGMPCMSSSECQSDNCNAVDICETEPVCF